MKRGIEKNVAQFAEAIVKLVFLSAVFFGTSVANAASINGNMELFGAYAVSGGTDLSDATALDLTSVLGTGGNGDIAVAIGTSGDVTNSPFSIPGPVLNLFQIDGWQVDIDTMAIVDQPVDASILTLAGTGTISALSAGTFDPTPTVWTLSANATGGTYSMTISAVPVPAAVWLFGSGLIGLIGIARRKTA
jgi:hypothetical protein